MIFLSAGEVAGDRQGALLAKTLQSYTAMPLYGLGGPAMANAGVQLQGNTAALGAVGLAETLPHAWAGWRIYRHTATWLRRHPPAVAVLIDYPAVNIPLARLLRRLGVPVVYYLPPEEWRWTHRGNGLLDRSHHIARLADRVLATHPLEAQAYQRLGATVELIGHPLLDLMAIRQPPRETARAALGISAKTTLVGLFPASRHQELQLVLPVLLGAAARLTTHLDLDFVLPVAAQFLEAPIRRHLSDYPSLRKRLHLIVMDDPIQATAQAMAAADLALSKSGTVTLELALAGVPQVVVYRLGALTEWLGRHLLRLSEADFQRVSLPNLILDEDLLPELLQHGATPAAVATAAKALLEPPARESQHLGYQRLRQHLGGEGAVTRAAEAIVNLAS